MKTPPTTSPAQFYSLRANTSHTSTSHSLTTTTYSYREKPLATEGYQGGDAPGSQTQPTHVTEPLTRRGKRPPTGTLPPTPHHVQNATTTGQSKELRSVMQPDGHIYIVLHVSYARVASTGDALANKGGTNVTPTPSYSPLSPPTTKEA